MAAITKSREYFNFNNQDYDFLVEFDNGERKISLNSQSLFELQIVEDFVDWYTTGYIIIDNPFDHFERLSDFGESNLAPPELDYKYRGDGRDIITLKIKPNIDSTADNSLGSENLKSEIWEIFLEGVVYDVDEIPTDEPQTKRKKFYFWDKEYQIMLEKNIEFTTANVGENKDKENPENLSNIERSLKAGEALLELFKSVDELKDKVPEEAGEEDWIEGDNNLKIFYTSPSNSKLIDDVNYILDHVGDSESNDFDLCFLQLNRKKDGEEKRKFSLESLSSFFQNAGTTSAGKYQLEKFVLMDLHETKKTVPIPKTPQDRPTVEKNIMTLTRSEIHSYQFVEMAGIDSANLIQVFPVHSYNLEGNQFNIHFKENTPQKAIEFQKEQYVKKIGPNSEPRLQLNEWKKNGYNLTNVFAYGNKENRYVQGRNKILMASLLNGSTISFTCRGQTSRQAGRFFSIEKNKFNDTDFDHRLEGQYLCTNVAHVFDFKSQNYTNEIIGVKLHRYMSNGGVTPEDDSELLI